jgi:hypothetical protein
MNIYGRFGNSSVSVAPDAIGAYSGGPPVEGKSVPKGYQATTTVGTVFQGTRMPLTVWLRAIWLVIGGTGINASQLQRQLGLSSYKTAWTLLHRVRGAMYRWDSDSLSGQVEVGDKGVHILPPDRRRPRFPERTLVAIAVESEEGRVGRVRVRRIKDAYAASLEEFVVRNVILGSTIATEPYIGYYGLVERGYPHKSVQQSGNPGSISEDLVGVGRVARQLDLWLLKTYHRIVSLKHLDWCFGEFDYRWNNFALWSDNRKYRDHRRFFHRLLCDLLSTRPETHQKGPK